jgi:hypothetical protein
MEIEVLGRILFFPLADEWTVIKGRQSFLLFKFLLSNSSLLLLRNHLNVEHFALQLERTRKKSVVHSALLCNFYY